jgi:hypothetical protein
MSILDLLDAVTEHCRLGFYFMIAEHRVGADLPKHEIGTRSNDIVRETREHLFDFFPVYAAIEHGDVIPWKAFAELGGEPAGITCGGRACAGARGR